MLTIEEYKQYTNIKSPNQDESITFALAYANDFIEKFCNVSLTPKSGKVTQIAGTERSVIFIDYPVTAVTKVSTREEWAPEDYELQDNILKLKRNVGFWDEVEVEYTYGYAEMPSTLKMAAIELTTYMLKREFNKSQSMGVTGENVTFLDPMSVPPHIRAALELYRVY